MANAARLVNDIWIPATDEHYKTVIQSTARKQRTPLLERPIWQLNKMQRALSFLTVRRQFIDVGAHVGFWSFYMAEFFDYVHAFEPIPLHYDLLQQNMPRYSNWTATNIALGDVNQTMRMKVPERTGRACIDPDGEIPVDVVPLDSFNYQNVDLIKIDVEGFEQRVLFGGEKTIKTNRPVIVIEDVGHNARYDHENHVNILKAWGAVELCEPIKGDRFLGWA